MLANKIVVVTDKMSEVMPKTDVKPFRTVMSSYVQQLRSGKTQLSSVNSGNANVDRLANAIVSSLSSEKINPKVDQSSKYYGYNYYWNYPWWWNYWYNSWTPYYWWNTGVRYIGGSSKNGSYDMNALENVLDSVDIQSMNLNCNNNRVCDLNVRFVKE